MSKPVNMKYKFLYSTCCLTYLWYTIAIGYPIRIEIRSFNAGSVVPIISAKNAIGLSPTKPTKERTSPNIVTDLQTKEVKEETFYLKSHIH